MKRNENLVMFSQEHHHGLVFCSRLQKADRADDQTLKHYVHDFWDKYLDKHFLLEDQLLLPLLSDTEIVARFLDEHRRIRQLIHRIGMSSNNVQSSSLELAELLNSHIRFEERIMFPWLEENIQPEEIDRIGESLEIIKISAHRFKPEFWKDQENSSN